ncbi:tRNA (adenosine(37)-N6)-threonylcarbamoyltransferase complex ATPase subunit type 1 TsaE [Hymenobacter nivis]|uniref:tRNA threonylcarbamoyladenosine biosynthesis protein TsaE n=1 Tax=Hymenobacter nivis TaxID=1850093 RepID=A0A2Z3GHJ6_9BACT|nr:tRNA (adenosine(37)-N6)-threonylcarbamoyltransferase complex ATPase subunit type 1 TsaE [Hymenobacter nivis]AWM32408.1 tRNA (adenosine(37)-N6)-threonylcarbamoyltransferase complex ATPase subunit type 1 TsaE [Hymenobacter nivis]
MLSVQLSVPALAALPAAAQQLAAAIAASGCPVVALVGEMGAGKTTLVRALGATLGIADDISSPTFGLVHEYRDGRGAPVYHFDFYRIDSVEEAARIGAAEYFDSGYLCLVEWPDRVAALLPVPRLELTLTPTGPEAREIELKIIN